MQQEHYVEIPVYARDGSVRAVFTVDAVDAEWIQRHRWKITQSGHINRNAVRDGKSVSIHVARAILGLEPGDILTADHINRDKLDNRRANLRAIPLAGQAQNRLRRGSNPFRGVTPNESRTNTRWVARGWVDGKNNYLGTFDCPAEAGRVALAFRMKHMPYAVD